MNSTDSKKADAKTILVVEDERLLRAMECSILQGCGYRVMEAETGRIALEVWDTDHDKIDVLLTDIRLLRSMSGVELAKRLHERKPQLKIIFTSGGLPREMDEKTLESMNACFLQKPYKHNELIQVVRDVLAGKVDRAIIEPAT
jgi:two-component system, cell cycle sensor histidine kinase and response regulator CckA